MSPREKKLALAVAGVIVFWCATQGLTKYRNALAENRARQTASEQAVLNNQELGLVMEEEGYRFVLYDDLNGEWVGQPERLFRPRQWPEWLVATLQAEGDAPRLASDEDKLRPDLVFFSSGETTPFEAEFTLGSDTDHRHRIESDGLNGLDWRAPGDEDEL